MTQGADTDSTGFPPGYFVVRSVASGRLLDVTMDDIENGTGIGLWPEKEKSLVKVSSVSPLVVNHLVVEPETGFRDPGVNNQASCHLIKSFSIVGAFIPISLLNRFSSLIHLERYARGPPDMLSMLKVRDLSTSDEG